MWLLIISAWYFFLPAYFANMAPVLFRWIPFLGKPIHEKLFGEHKTWRGLIAAPILAVVVFWLQQKIYLSGFQEWSLIDYSDFSLWLGWWMGSGAILGDLVKSYYKRKEGIKVGVRWFPFDQLDFVIGGIVGAWVFYVPPLEVMVVLLLISPLLHIIVNHLGYCLKIRKEKW